LSSLQRSGEVVCSSQTILRIDEDTNFLDAMPASINQGCNLNLMRVDTELHPPSEGGAGVVDVNVLYHLLP